MKQKRDMYQEIRYGKKALIIVGIVVMVLSLAAFVGGILLIVFGSLNPNGAWEIIWRVVLGSMMVIFGAIFFCIAVSMLSITRTMMPSGEGSVADGNRSIGTANVKLCPKCGAKLDKDAKFCQKCGEKLELDFCPNCGHPISKGSAFCDKCGKEIK